MRLTTAQREKIVRNFPVLLDGRWFLETIRESGFNSATAFTKRDDEELHSSF